MEHVLLQSSENIKEILRLMKLHEENITRYVSQDNDVVMTPSDTNTKKADKPLHTNTYDEYEYTSLPYWAIRHPYNHNDPMILIKECGHTCRKDHFLQWIKHHNTCMECSSVLF
jgi:hypothetical protein